MAVFLIAIPALILEISIGQAYRGGTVIAMNNVHRRLKGVGMGPVFVSFIVVQYFTVNLAWIMNYFRNSFTSPLPWENRIEEFYWQDIIGNVEPLVPRESVTVENSQDMRFPVVQGNTAESQEKIPRVEHGTVPRHHWQASGGCIQVLQDIKSQCNALYSLYHLPVTRIPVASLIPISPQRLHPTFWIARG